LPHKIYTIDFTRPCPYYLFMIAIFAALEDEIRPIKDEMVIDKSIRLKALSIYAGKYRGIKMAVVRSGIGSDAMKNAVKYALQTLNPSMMVNIGYGGGLDPKLHPGDIVIAEELINGSDGASIKADADALKHAISVAELKEIHYKIGKVVTVEAPILDASEKAYTGARFGAIVCDMESYHFASSAIDAGKRFLVVKSILDPMDFALPECIKTMTGGDVSGKGFLSSVRAQDITRLPQLIYFRREARRSIEDFITKEVRHEYGI